MTEVKEQIEAVLAELKSSGDVEASAVIRRDGLMVGSDLSAKIEPGTIASMAASLVGAAETTSSELKRGIFQEIIIDSEKGKVVAIGAGKLALLVCLVKKEGNLGFVLISMERAAKKIEAMLG